MLMFTAIRYSDAGRYRCVAGNSKTPPVTSNYAQIRVTRTLISLEIIIFEGVQFSQISNLYHQVLFLSTDPCDHAHCALYNCAYFVDLI